MKIILQLFLIFNLLTVYCQDLSQNLMASFSFDNSLVDNSNSSISVTNNGSVFTFDRYSIPNYALGLNGSNYLSFNDNSVKVNFPITISAWVKVNSFSELNVIFKSDNIYDNYHGYWLSILPNSGTVVMNMSGGNGTANVYNRRSFTTSSGVQLNQWVLITAIMKSATDMKIYFDCEQQIGTYSGSGLTILAYSSTSSRIGSSIGDNALQSDRFFNGDMDNFKIWNKELTSEEITSLCQSLNVEQLSKENSTVSVYPNPTADFVTIDYQKTFTTLNYLLFDVSGAIVSEGILENSNPKINIVDIPSGFYFLEIDNAYRFKVVKE
jgi:hypothetical protein